MTQSEFDAAFNNDNNIRYPSDCERIKKIGARMGIVMSLTQAEQIWDYWSDTMCAGWLNISDDEEIERAIRSFIAEKLYR